MFGTLREIEITDDLILKVAKEQFNKLNEEDFDDVRGYYRDLWRDYTVEDLETFNEIVEIFEKINFDCYVKSLDRGIVGSWDVRD